MLLRVFGENLRREVDYFPGLRTVAGYGHTPGQTYCVLESDGEKLLFWGDIGHVQKEGDHFRWIPSPYINDSQKAR
jgi:glyoxylase-like metal-dependent hydrolase (beta-lactamase superfamily II)